MDDPTAAKLFELLRSQQILISDLHVDVQALIDCLSQLPEFEQGFEKRKAEIRDAPEFREAKKSALASIDTMIRALKKSDGGA